MTPHPGLHEVFEHKEVNRDPSFRCPVEAEKITRSFFAWLEKTAVQALEEMVAHVVALSGRPHFDLAGWFKPDSTLRVLHYDRVSTDQAPMPVLDETFPCHTDSSFITIAPKSTMAALESQFIYKMVVFTAEFCI